MATLEELEDRVIALEAAVVGLTAQLGQLPTLTDTVSGLTGSQSVLATTVQGFTDRIDQEVIPLIDTTGSRIDGLEALTIAPLQAAVADHESRITVLENPIL